MVILADPHGPATVQAPAIRLLLLEDSPLDAELVTEHLSSLGRPLDITQVDTREGFTRALAEDRFDLVLADYVLPSFDGESALTVARELAPLTPFIFVSGTLGEEVAVEALKRGATDYVVKSRLQRLPLVVVRALSEARERAERQRAEDALRRLNEGLERRVAERTEALADTINRLNAEILRRERMEAVLLQAQKMEAIGQMTGGIAHDFNNLLQILVGNLDLIHARAGDAAQVRKLVDTAQEAVQRGARLTSHLLAFARRQALRPQVVDLNALLRETQELVGRAVGASVEVALDLDPRAGACHLDPAQFEAAILNLAVNARDAMPDGGRLEIRTRCLAEGAEEGRVELTVADTGTGMPPEVLAKVFEPFFTTKSVGRGSGLGLSQVYGFVRQSGGEVTLDCPERGGTVVSIRLPRLDVPAPGPNRPALAGFPGGRGERLLVVEDDNAVRQTAAETLEALGYHVVVASCAAEALALLERGPGFDLLFSDVVMPGGMSGLQLAERARKAWPGMRLLLTSGFAAEDVDALGTAPGIELLGKPFRRADLAQRVRHLLDQANPESRDGQAGRLRILLVEDEALIRLHARTLLEEMGHAVEEADCGQAALSCLEDAAYDLMLTDLGLPDMGGEDLVREARSRRGGLPVVLVTGRTVGGGSPVDGFPVLPKPFTQGDLARVLAGVAKG